MKKYALFGQNIKYSISPFIHKLISEKLNKEINYKIIDVDENEFSQHFLEFFESGGFGANITTPFKQNAYKACKLTTEEAESTKVVNSLVLQKDGSFFGDNTDYRALKEHLKKINLDIYKKNVMIIGYGATTKTLIHIIKKLKPRIITINGRNIGKAKTDLDSIDYPLNFFEKSEQKIEYNVIFNCIPKTKDKNHLINVKTNNSACAYDLNYHRKEDSFTKWIEDKEIKEKYNGINMLVLQAIYSWKLWYNSIPEIDELQKNIIKSVNEHC